MYRPAGRSKAPTPTEGAAQPAPRINSEGRLIARRHALLNGNGTVHSAACSAGSSRHRTSPEAARLSYVQAPFYPDWSLLNCRVYICHCDQLREGREDEPARRKIPHEPGLHSSSANCCHRAAADKCSSRCTRSGSYQLRLLPWLRLMNDVSRCRKPAPDSGQRPPGQIARGGLTWAYHVRCYTTRISRPLARVLVASASGLFSDARTLILAQSSRLAEFGGLGISFNICRGTLGSLAMFTAIGG